MNDQPRNNLTYLEALHGMQTGVAYDRERQGQSVPDQLKHLRVGINSAMVNDAALVRLLVSKGLITESEYVEELRLEANRELDRMEDQIRLQYGSPDITLR